LQPWHFHVFAVDARQQTDVEIVFVVSRMNVSPPYAGAGLGSADDLGNTDSGFVSPNFSIR
jgi:hypothetical protein